MDMCAACQGWDFVSSTSQCSSSKEGLSGLFKIVSGVSERVPSLGGAGK